MYSLMRNKKKENIYDGWFDDKIEYWFANKGINFMRVDELVGFLQAYEIFVHSTQKS